MRKKSSLTLLASIALASLPVLVPVADAATLDAGTTTFEFGVDDQTVSDSDALSVSVPEGTALHYTAVATIDGAVVDAVVTFVEGTNNRGWSPSNSGWLGYIDYRSPGSAENPYISSYLEVENTSLPETNATFTVHFYVSGTYTGTGTGTPVTLSNLTMNIYDIDEGQSVTVEDVAGYSLSTNTHVVADSPSAGVYDFVSGLASTEPEDGSANTIGRVKVVFEPTSSIRYTLRVPGDAVDGAALYYLDFSRGLPWEDQFGGGENTTNLPETGMAVGILAGLSVAMIASGAALGARRRLRA